MLQNNSFEDKEMMHWKKIGASDKNLNYLIRLTMYGF